VGSIPSSLPAPNRAKKTTILLVEDDPFQAFAHRAVLERSFASIERAGDASEALIRVVEPGFVDTLALIVVGLRLPGLAGPAFVAELTARLPRMPVLVVGRGSETASNYSGENVKFLPGDASAEDLLAAVKGQLAERLRRVA